MFARKINVPMAEITRKYDHGFTFLLTNNIITNRTNVYAKSFGLPASEGYNGR